MQLVPEAPLSDSARARFVVLLIASVLILALDVVFVRFTIGGVLIAIASLCLILSAVLNLRRTHAR